MTDWPDAVARVLAALITTAGQVLMYLLMWRVFKWWAYERTWMDNRRGAPGPKALLRRIWCRHAHVARTRDPYGRHCTLCVECGTDVNAGKPREEWR